MVLIHYQLYIISLSIPIRKIPVKVEDDDGEGHPPGENEEEKSDEHPESVREIQVLTFLHPIISMHILLPFP